ncbi:hypothetical protein B0I35DRAFT_515382 [Stachybotrys elegans]|uniref:Uncharacterized protein n=1 Tax=Stachybotrys elegans TaxID=80388 RepID=A0A8K0SII0_9HYPO|nr:hypothetical protein B0I35DRAFT_515382 [Stachybotrys elegans]
MAKALHIFQSSALAGTPLFLYLPSSSGISWGDICGILETATMRLTSIFPLYTLPETDGDARAGQITVGGQQQYQDLQPSSKLFSASKQATAVAVARPAPYAFPESVNEMEMQLSLAGPPEIAALSSYGFGSVVVPQGYPYFPTQVFQPAPYANPAGLAPSAYKPTESQPPQQAFTVPYGSEYNGEMGNGNKSDGSSGGSNQLPNGGRSGYCFGLSHEAERIRRTFFHDTLTQRTYNDIMLDLRDAIATNWSPVCEEALHCMIVDLKREGILGSNVSVGARGIVVMRCGSLPTPPGWYRLVLSLPSLMADSPANALIGRRSSGLLGVEPLFKFKWDRDTAVLLGEDIVLTPENETCCLMALIHKSSLSEGAWARAGGPMSNWSVARFIRVRELETCAE